MLLYTTEVNVDVNVADSPADHCAAQASLSTRQSSLDFPKEFGGVESLIFHLRLVLINIISLGLLCRIRGRIFGGILGCSRLFCIGGNLIFLK